MKLRSVVLSALAASLLVQAEPARATGTKQYASFWTVASGRYEFQLNWAGAFGAYVAPADWGAVEPWTGDRPWSVAAKVLWMRGIWGTWVPGNTLFPLDQYEVSCSPEVPLLGPYTIRGGYLTPDRQPARCKVLKAPVVDMDWIRNNLDGQGYLYVISYPQKDFGNGHAHVNWVRSCHTGGSQAHCYHGMARVTGAGWKNQFPRITGHMPVQYFFAERPPTPAYDFDYKYGSAEADRILGAMPEAQRGVAVYNWAWETGIEALAATTDSSGASHEILTDDWLGAPSAPPVPLTPPAAPDPATPASPVNLGSPSTGTATGTGHKSSDEDQGAAFQWEAYCRSPNPDGSQRPQGWIENCLATRH